MRAVAPLRVDYLVAGLRIRLDPESHTPGPRNHINQFLDALTAGGGSYRLFVASDQPLLGRIAALPEGAAAGPAAADRATGSGSRTPRAPRVRRRARLLAGDALRFAAAGWSAARVRAWSTGSTASVIYERTAVLQCLGPAHRGRRSSVWVVESNGIFSRETAEDRQALGSTALAAAVERWTYRRADLVVTVSEHLRNEVCEFAGVSPDKVVVLPNAVPDAALAATPRRPAGPPILGFAGSLVPWQRLDRLLEACAPALRVGRLRLEIVGAGPESGRVAALADALDIAGAVALLGRLPHPAVLARMATWSFGYAGHVATSSAAMYHSPLKLWEYAGLGLDVLASPSADAAALRRAGVRIVDVGPAGVAALLELPPRGPDQLAALRADLRAQHSWAARIATLQARLAPLLAARGTGPGAAGEPG